jgi:hypothetical protein
MATWSGSGCCSAFRMDRMESDVDSLTHGLDSVRGDPRETSALKDRLMAIRKRKRAFAGQVVEAQVMRRRMAEEQQYDRDR